MPAMTLSRQQITLLITLTLVWGFNWPMLKLGVNHYPPLSFRSLSMWMGLPFLALVLYVKKVPFRIPRADWQELLMLATTNMLVWHVLIMLAVQSLSSGRSAILGYTMPIFSAMIGVFWYGAALRWRGWLGVGCAALGVVLLLWHELSAIAASHWAWYWVWWQLLFGAWARSKFVTPACRRPHWPSCSG